jgi:hypothetical protein
MENKHKQGVTTMETKHTAGALKLAEILIPEGIDRKGHQSKIKTAYGEKTREGLADLIDRETSVPDMLGALKEANEILKPTAAMCRKTSAEIEEIRCKIVMIINLAEGRAEQ